MTNKEAKDILAKLEEHFDLSIYKNNQEIMDALEIGIEAISKKENLEKLSKTPFNRVNKKEQYCLIDTNDEIIVAREDNTTFDDKQYECFNYFSDKEFAKQVMLHQLLYRKLLKFKLARETNNVDSTCFYINIRGDNLPYIEAIRIFHRNCNGIYFNNSTIAHLALKEVVEPFLKEYPDFIWNL